MGLTSFGRLSVYLGASTTQVLRVSARRLMLLQLSAWKAQRKCSDHPSECRMKEVIDRRSECVSGMNRTGVQEWFGGFSLLTYKTDDFTDLQAPKRKRKSGKVRHSSLHTITHTNSGPLWLYLSQVLLSSSSACRPNEILVWNGSG